MSKYPFLGLGFNSWSAKFGRSDSILWTPAELDGVQLWLDADDSSTIVYNKETSLVTDWHDKSGNNRHATQGAGANQPTYTTAGLNGKNVLTFSGDYLTIPSAESDYFAYQSAFIVYSDTSTASFVTPLGGKYGGSAGGPYHGYNDETQIFSAQYTSSITRNGDNFKNGTDIGDGLSTPRPGSTPAIFSYIPTGQFNNPRRLGVIGADFADSANRGITGLIAEIIILEGDPDLNDPSDTNRKKIEGYLAHNWGLAGDLSSDHPYKSSAPAK